MARKLQEQNGLGIRENVGQIEAAYPVPRNVDYLPKDNSISSYFYSKSDLSAQEFKPIKPIFKEEGDKFTYDKISNKYESLLDEYGDLNRKPYKNIGNFQIAHHMIFITINRILIMY